MRIRRGRNAFDSKNIDPLVQLWMLRAMVSMEGIYRIVRVSISIDLDRVLSVFGIDDDPLWEDLPSNRKADAIYALLKARWIKAERDAAGLQGPAAMAANLERLAELLGLSQTDVLLLMFACLASGNGILADVVNALGSLSTADAIHALSKILGITPDAVHRALNPDGALARSGLLRIAAGDGLDLSDKLTLLGDHFHEAIQEPDIDPVRLLRGAVRQSDSSALTLDNYTYLGTDLHTLRTYLGRVLEDRRPGVNVLLYGPPGTGKTQLTRVLAKYFGCPLFEVVTEDEDGDPSSPSRRLQAYSAAQRLLAIKQSLIVFDECSDVFWDDVDTLTGRGRSRSGGQKGWFHRAIESNTVPTFWLTNELRGMDRALLRRFDIVLEMPIPPKSVRRAIAAIHCGKVISELTIDALAGSERLAPAVLTRAAGVVEVIAGSTGAPDLDAAIVGLVNQTLRVQDHAEIRQHDPDRLPEVYDPSLVNADIDLRAMAAGVKRAGRARICLYGVPGSGKSAYVRWLAQYLDRPLVVRRASDLLSKWVGMTEQNIAQAFREAERENAVLLLDEVDSFLQDRRGAEKSWEVTQVNEMLTQIESYGGVFVATTNLLEGLDPASLRRFDLKARFQYLRSDQAWELLRRQCRGLGIPEPGEAERRRIDPMRLLAPGDFAAVSRRHAFHPLSGAREFLDALAEECALKSGGRQAIGFAAG